MRLRHFLYGLALAPLLYSVFAVAMPLWSYKQDQAENVVITQFGNPVRVDRTPGLGGKYPFFENAHRFTTKLVDYRSIPQDALTSDKKTIQIDFYAMWRIADPMLFIQSVRPATVDAAKPIIDDFVYSEMRNLISENYSLALLLKEGDKVQTRVKEKVAPQLISKGIEIVDVRLTTTNPTKDVQGAVYNRMKAERGQKAQSDRSEGDRRSIQTRADADREATQLNSEAYAKAQKIRGEADAEALEIIQRAYSRDPELAFFLRELQLLQDTTGSDDELIISTNSELYDLMKGQGKKK